MGTEAESPLLPVAPGDIVAGKYSVVRLLGQGGMGSVFEARHRALGQRVAIKLLHPCTVGHEEAVERFLREARAAANLTSDHVVRVFDVGTHDSGLPFMVMEFLEGLDLGELLERRGALPIADSVRYVLQASEAVAEAHEAGIVHRDLKPSNLFLVRTGSGKSSGKRTAKVKVLDFGISKNSNLPHGSVQTLTGPRSVMGSPSYMSPEQVRSTKSVDARTDVWSLGVILYELLTGGTAFDGETLGDVFAKIREEPLTPIRTLRPAVPASLEAIIDRCLDRDREKRFADAAALAEALRAVALEGCEPAPVSELGGRPSMASHATTAFDLVPASLSRPSAPESGTHAPWISVRTRTPRRRAAVLAALLGTFTAVAVTAFAIASGDAPPSPPSPAIAEMGERDAASRVAPSDPPGGAIVRVETTPGPVVVPQVAPSAVALQGPPAAAPSATTRRTMPVKLPGTSTPLVPSPGPTVPSPRPRSDPDDLGI